MQILSALMSFTKQCVELDANQSCMSVGAQCTECPLAERSAVLVRYTSSYHYDVSLLLSHSLSLVWCNFMASGGQSLRFHAWLPW